jgi:predicted HAD superfamily Cof-like phosphohydrolase
MRKEINNLIEFNEAFGIDFPKSPLLVDAKTQELRVNLLLEELEEYRVANTKGDITEVLDAIGDMLYIVLGTAVQHGMQNIVEEAFRVIHSSNMSKLDKDGNPIINGDQMYDPRRPIGKVLKSEMYWAPTEKLDELICKQG